MKLTPLKTRRVETIVKELDEIQRRITQRAYEIFKDRGTRVGAALDDWLTAERQTVWKPAIEVCKRDAAFVIQAAVAGVEPRQLDIQVTPETLLIKAETAHSHPESKGIVHVCEFEPGQLFRLIRLPEPIDPEAVKAEYRNGLLRVTAAVAARKPARKVEVQAA
jgi:HSP20 family protein